MRTMAVIVCAQHGNQVTRWPMPTEAQCVEWHDFCVKHARCRLVVVPVRRELARRAA